MKIQLPQISQNETIQLEAPHKAPEQFSSATINTTRYAPTLDAGNRPQHDQFIAQRPNRYSQPVPVAIAPTSQLKDSEVGSLSQSAGPSARNAAQAQSAKRVLKEIREQLTAGGSVQTGYLRIQKSDKGALTIENRSKLYPFGDKGLGYKTVRDWVDTLIRH